MTSVFPTLAQVTSPNGAQAAATQTMTSSRLVCPRFFRQRVMRFNNPMTPVSVPHKDSAMWFKQIHAAYLSAQFVSYARNAQELLHLYSSETIELRAGSKWDSKADCGYDGTLRPRALAVWLSVNALVAAGDAGDRMLDALATWSQLVTPKGVKIANVVRMTVVASEDAKETLRRTLAQSVRPVQNKSSWTFRVGVRWVTQQGCERTEMEEFDTVPATADGALALIQQTVVRLSGSHEAPIHVALMSPINKAVATGSFYDIGEKLHTDFKALVQSPPSCTLDAAAAHPESAVLENTGVVVRLSERRMGDKGITHETAFHGVVLSFGGFRQEAIDFAKAAAETPEGYLGVPIGMQESAMALHVCAVHAEKRPLGKLVTLYGPLGRCGEPIHERGGTWVWVENAAVRPIDAALLKDWCMYPCDKASIMPSNWCLHEPYRTHFSRAQALYSELETYKFNKTASNGSLVTEAVDELDVLPPRPESAMSTDDKQTERHMLAALRVGLDSKRTTIGEACAYLIEYDPPSNVVKMLMSAAGRLGVGASLCNMVALCYESMEAAKVAPNVVDENANLKRLVDVALTARAEDAYPESKRAKPITVSSNERVRRMLKTLNLKAGKQATVYRSHKSKTDDLLSVICDASGVVLGGTHPTCMAPLGKLTDDCVDLDDVTWENRVVQALGKCIDLLLRQSKREPAPVWTNHFVLSSRIGSANPCVFVERMNDEGSLATSTFDAMMDVGAPRVLIVNFLEKGQVRVTATVSLN